MADPIERSATVRAVVVNIVARTRPVNPQSHVHITDFIRPSTSHALPSRADTGLLASAWFIHVGDLHYRLSDTAYD